MQNEAKQLSDEQIKEEIKRASTISTPELIKSIRKNKYSVLAAYAIQRYIFHQFHLPWFKENLPEQSDNVMSMIENIFYAGYMHGMRHKDNAKEFIEILQNKDKKSEAVSEPAKQE